MTARRWLGCVLLILALLWPMTPGAAQVDPATQDPAIAIRQAEEEARSLRESLEDPSTPAAAWYRLLMVEATLLNMRPQTSTGDQAADDSAQREREREVRDRVLSEWKAARPDDPAPYLMELQLAPPPEGIESGILGLVERFPDNPSLLRNAMEILAQREEITRANRLIDGALARHPDNAALYPVAVDFYEIRNWTRAKELADAWIERWPGNGGALRKWMMLNSSPRDSQKMAERVERFVAAGGSDAERVEVCGDLLTIQGGAYREAATRCLNQAAGQTRDPGLKTSAAGLLAGAEGGPEDLEQALAEVPAERRLDVVLHAIRALGEGECARKVSLLKLLPKETGNAGEGGEEGNRLAMKLSALRGCETYVPARDLYLETLSQARTGSLKDVLWAWFVPVNGSYPDDFSLGPKIVAVLEERLKQQRQERDVWEALGMGYELAGLDERRAAHLAAWLESGLYPPDAQQIVWLGEFYAGQESPEAGIRALRAGWRKSRRLEIASALANLLLVTGKTADFTALTAELADTPLQSGGKQPPEAHLARLLRARGTLVRQGPEAALVDYQAWLDQVPSVTKEEAVEYLSVAGGVLGEEAAGNAAQSLCSKAVFPTGSSPSECAANLLAEVGDSGSALELLDAAAERSPDDSNLLARLGYAAEQAGEWDRAEAAYNRVLKADPKSPAAWGGLARIAETRGDAATVEAVVRRAEQAMGEKTQDLVFTLARSYRANGQAARAIEILKAWREGHSAPEWVDEELRQAYEALGSEAPVSSGSAAGTAGAPTAEDLRAQREAEAALLGLGGPIDEPRGREITKALAQQGNPYANIRLSIWQQAGTQGLTANPRQAAATAEPYLAALRAAAEGGEPFAQYLWGTVLLRGIGVAKQGEAGGAWLRKAAEKGEPWALYNLGYMAQHGDGAEEDLDEALRWYQRAAEAGHPVAMLSLANLLLDEASPLRQPAAGVPWLARAAEKGLPGAVAWYSALLYYGVPGVPADPARARPWLEKAAALGESRGLFDLAASLLMGLGGPPDEVRAVKLLEQAGERGNARAFWQLAWQATLGRGTVHDGKAGEAWIERAAALGSDLPYEILGAREEEGEPARRWFAAGLRALERLAASGDPHAGGLLARLYSGGFGAPEDPTRAVALARPAAAGGSTEAMRVLGWAYDSGAGVEADLAQAAEWRRRGAEAGHSYSMMWYSQKLFDGEGVEKDPVAALTWLERSGERGNYWAVRDLGHLYDEGWHGIPRDERKAEFWKRQAVAAFNDPEARGWLLARGLIE